MSLRAAGGAQGGPEGKFGVEKENFKLKTKILGSEKESLSGDGKFGVEKDDFGWRRKILG